MAMTQQEFEDRLRAPTDTVQIFRLDNADGIEILVRFPHNGAFGRMVRYRAPVPAGKVLSPASLAAEIRDHVVERLQQHKDPGDEQRIRETNWTSMLAAMQQHVIEFNNERAKTDLVVAAMKGRSLQ